MSLHCRKTPLPILDGWCAGLCEAAAVAALCMQRQQQWQGKQLLHKTCNCNSLHLQQPMRSGSSRYCGPVKRGGWSKSSSCKNTAPLKQVTVVPGGCSRVILLPIHSAACVCKHKSDCSSCGYCNSSRGTPSKGLRSSGVWYRVSSK